MNPDTTDASSDGSIMSSVVSAITGIFSESSSSSSITPLSAPQLAEIDKNIERLEEVVECVCNLWSLANPAHSAPLHMRRTNSDLVGLLQDDVEDEVYVKEWAPGVCEPQRVKEVGNVLTLRGRNQVCLFPTLLRMTF